MVNYYLYTLLHAEAMVKDPRNGSIPHLAHRGCLVMSMKVEKSKSKSQQISREAKDIICDVFP